MGRMIGTTTQYTFLPSNTYTNGYTYDAASNRTGFTAPDGSTNTYAYDNLNRLTGLTNSLTGQFGFGYDALSRRTSLTRPNNVSTSYSYDSLSRLLSVLHQAGGATIDGASYTLDNAGNRTSKLNQLNGVTENYTYDPIYQLTQVQQVVNGTTNATENYSYDAVGNRLSSLNVASYSYNNSNELTSSSDGYSYTYDFNGNTLTKSNASGTTQYAWDFENRLTSATLPGGGGVVSFKYDWLGNRIQKGSPNGTSSYLYDGSNPIEEIDGNGAAVARYSLTTRVDEPVAEVRSGATSFYATDGLGSATSLTSAAGSLSESYAFNSLGKQTQTSGSLTNPFQYTGREFDSETGVYYYRARYYDPQIGRFMSEDPVSFDGGINFYAYVQNNPTNMTDPRGLKSCMLTTLGYVCWSDGNQNGGTIFLPEPPPNPIPNAISNSFSAFSKCANNFEVKCQLPAAPGGNPLNPPKGPKGDMGVTPNEGNIPIPQFDDPFTKACDCLKKYPLAAFDLRFHFTFGDHNFLIKPSCMISIP